MEFQYWELCSLDGQYSHVRYPVLIGYYGDYYFKKKRNL